MSHKDMVLKKAARVLAAAVVVLVGAGIATSISPSNAVAVNDKAPRIEAVPGQFVVELNENRALHNQAVLENRLGGKIVDQVRPNMVVIQTNHRGNNMLSVAQQLSSLPEVKIAEPNYILRALATPNDVDYGRLWGLSNKGGLDSAGGRGLNGLDISAEKAWDIQKGSKNVVVAVIDTGIDYTHPELVNNMWVNEAEKNGQPGVDDDGNGYIDDIHGFNFVANTGDAKDDNGHGTHCAGTIGAEGNNGNAIVGVNWNVSIMAIKFLDAGGSGSLANAVKALDYASASKAIILSNSWGGAMVSQVLEQAVGRTKDAGKLFVAAAGNDGTNNDTGNSVPASYGFDNVISVAAIDNRGSLAYFSNYGVNKVHVAAPGVNIYSTLKNGGYDTYSGTSMATPHVSGIAALVLANNPDWTYQQVRERIFATARPLRSLKGKMSTGGLADAYYALSGETPPADPNDPEVWTERVDNALSSTHPYENAASQLYTITVPGAKRISVHFAKFETEASYDKIQFLTVDNKSVGTMSGNQSGAYGPIVDGDTVTLKFTSDSSVNGYGFDIDYIAVER